MRKRKPNPKKERFDHVIIRLCGYTYFQSYNTYKYSLWDKMMSNKLQKETKNVKANI